MYGTHKNRSSLTNAHSGPSQTLTTKPFSGIKKSNQRRVLIFSPLVRKIEFLCFFFATNFCFVSLFSFPLVLLQERSASPSLSPIPPPATARRSQFQPPRLCESAFSQLPQRRPWLLPRPPPPPSPLSRRRPWVPRGRFPRAASSSAAPAPAPPPYGSTPPDTTGSRRHLERSRSAPIFLALRNCTILRIYHGLLTAWFLIGNSRLWRQPRLTL